MTEFKDESLREEYHKCPTFLQAICEDFIRLSNDAGIIPVITRVLERVDGSSGVHEAGRAVDFRDEHAGRFLYNHDQRAHIVATLNSKYYRRDGHNTIIWHSFQGNPHHFHIQIAADLRVYEKNVSSV